MVHLGVDLAWSARNRSGLAVVDANGALIDSTTARSDAEIDAWVLSYRSELSTVAIDAPLIVPNASGNRFCERQINAHFGRFDAGAYPSNRGRAIFDPPRAAAIAERHGWSVDPEDTATPDRPVCIEVYPHPATIELFHLGRTIKYKRGTLAMRREGLSELCGHIESLTVLRLARHERWRYLRDVAAGADRPVDLKSAEDEIDAVLCAHIAWLWHADRSALRVYGDLERGYIVAPPPPSHDPTPRAARTD